MGGDKTQVFAEHGPKHMAGAGTASGIEIDWGNEEHVRCITACLVKGAYVMEGDRFHGKDPASALAPAWWESFHFRRKRDYKLEFACKCVICKTSELFHGGIPTKTWFIYGAVFEYAPPPDAAVANRQSAPRYIVAFRGTMAGGPTGPADMRNNLNILLDKQHLCDRFIHARGMVKKLVQQESGVWLAGHSLGASIALDVGRYMMINKGKNLPTFLFNPPHVSVAAAVGEKAKMDVYTVSSIGRYLLGILVPQHKDRMEELFRKLAPWVPNLYVHPKDFICEGFIYDFEQRELLRQQHPWLVSATLLSYRDMFYSLCGRHSEQAHLLPSAKLCKNQSQQQHGEHGLRQWWQPQGSEELVLSAELYTWHLDV